MLRQEHEGAASEHALLQALATPLSALLDAYLPERQRLQNAKPVLQLALAVDSHSRSASSIAATLAAFTALVRFVRSHLRLHASRARRRAFWMRVFTSAMMTRHWSEREHWEAPDTLPRRTGIATWMLEAPDFPEFHIQVILRGRVDPALESMLACFAGTPAIRHDDRTEASSAAAAAPIDVTLDVSGLDTAQPDFVTSVVDLTCRLFALDARSQQVALQSVEYKSSFPFALQVALQLALLSAREIRIRELFVVSRSFRATPTPAEAASVHQLIAAALTSPRFDASANALECVRFAGSLTVGEFAAVCSALRCGTSLRKLELVCSFATMTPGDTQQCWRWLAFGAFCARPGESLRALQELVLDQIVLSLTDAEAVERTLVNPSELALADPSTPAGAVAVPLTLCTIASDAVLYTTPSHGSARINEPFGRNESERALEVLCKHDGWRCVVVPCHGLAWIEAMHVRALRGTDNSTPVPKRVRARRLALTLQSLPPSSKTSPQALRRFIQSIGDQLDALSVVDVTWSREFVPVIRAIGRSCVHMQHLALRRCRLHTPVATALRAALRGPLGRHLLSLDLNESASPNPQFPMLGALTAVLPDPTHVPVLNELRLDVRRLTTNVLHDLDAWLLARPRLAYLELQDCYPHEYSAQKPLARARREFSAAHDGRAAGGLDTRQRMALVSVLCADDSRSRLLDPALVALVIAFANDASTLRIAWRTPPPIHYHL